MKNYIIQEDTLAIIGIHANCCRIIEKNREFYVFAPWQQILNDSCLYYGSSYQGRLEGSKDILNKDYKVPIILSEMRKLIFFAVGNQTDFNCVWISLKMMKDYQILSGKIKFIFYNNKELYVYSGKESFENQLLKAYNLERLLNLR